MKNAIIGGGSVQWTAKLAIDMMTRACQRMNDELHGTLRITSNPDRTDTLRNADFVILCVSIGGLKAMGNDFAIPEKYGIYQAVGDTVGPGWRGDCGIFRLPCRLPAKWKQCVRRPGC